MAAFSFNPETKETKDNIENDNIPGLVSSVRLLFIYGDVIKADNAPKKLGLATQKTSRAQRSGKGTQRSKSYPIVRHVSFPCSPHRLSVTVNTSNTRYLCKTQRTQLLGIHIISSRNRDMDPPQRSAPAEGSMIKPSFVV